MSKSEYPRQPRSSRPPEGSTSVRPPRDYADETGYEMPSGRASGDRTYRESRASKDRFTKNLQYGRYLEVPKGRKSIFSQPNGTMRRGPAVAIAVAIILIALIIVIALWPR